jgi:hypothetical protein
MNMLNILQKGGLLQRYHVNQLPKSSERGTHDLYIDTTNHQQIFIPHRVHSSSFTVTPRDPQKAIKIAG